MNVRKTAAWRQLQPAQGTRRFIAIGMKNPDDVATPGRSNALRAYNLLRLEMKRLWGEDKKNTEKRRVSVFLISCSYSEDIVDSW